MPPTSVGTRASKPALWRCVCLHQSTWDARQVREPCSIIYRAIQSCKPQGFAYPGPAELSGSFCGKPVVFCPSHREIYGLLSLGSRWRRFKWMRKDVSSVSAEKSSQGKRQHVIEVCNFVDAGTSIALFAQAREDFHEQTAMEAVISFLQMYGRPHQITFDRDPRWVGSVSGRDFPSPLRRLLLCLGIQPNICPPHRPDKNAYVERYHRSFGQECLQVHRPSTLQEVCEVTEAFLQHYNEERPHQGRTCGNVPPRVAFPTLPTLPALPERVDPDAWLTPLDQKMYLRHVGRDGCVDVDLATYYIGSQVAGRTILLQIVAESRQFAVWHQDQVVKLLPIKGLVGQEMALDDYLKYIRQEALAAPRRSSARGSRKVRQSPLWGEGA